MTVAEILEAIRVASIVPEPENAYTGPEVCAAMGWGKVRFTKEMRPLLASGQVHLVRVRRPAIDGRMANLPAYQFRNAP